MMDDVDKWQWYYTKNKKWYDDDDDVVIWWCILKRAWYYNKIYIANDDFDNDYDWSDKKKLTMRMTIVH